jgi:hypothetical protein
MGLELSVKHKLWYSGKRGTQCWGYVIGKPEISRFSSVLDAQKYAKNISKISCIPGAGCI